MTHLIVNGKTVIATENKKLLTFLREDLNLVSVKNGCSEGACGTCMVLIDGKPTKACIPSIHKSEGKHIITVEGLSTREKEIYSYAFLEAGAVQCGFCIPLTPVTSPTQALSEGAPLIHASGNILQTEHLVRGHADEHIAQSKYVVTHHYSTPFTEHAFLEIESAIALPDQEGILIYSADQGAYQTRKECAKMLGLPLEQIRVIGKTVGGGFGGKEDMSVQHHATLLAYHTRSPVKVSLSRKESILVHPKRHAMEMDFTTACDENGYLTAMKAVIISDTIAYASLGGPVLQRACTHAAGPYNYHDIDIFGQAVYTNNPPAGAFRGFGVTQSCFAIESNLNELAKLVGISPYEIRWRNAIRPGQVLPNGQIADESTALVETLEAVKDTFESYPYAGIACAMKNAGLGVGIPDKMGSDKENPVSHITYGYATQVVVLDETGKLQKVVAAHDVGKAINRKNVEGQIEDGITMSLGYALTEDYPLKDCVPTAKFGTLGLFQSVDVPEIEAVIIEKNDSELAYGAKGIGEICSIPTAPAVALAYERFDGKFRGRLPLEGTIYSKRK